LSGPLIITPYTGSGGSKLQMGSSSDPGGQDILNLLPGGVLRVKQILDQSVNSSSIFNFNGGTLSPNSDEYAATFMQFLDYCYVLDGGGFVDTAGFNITIGQDMQSGGSGTGGLTKQGLGKLNLTGNNSYTGPTVVQAGALGGSGTLSGPVTVQSGASLAPGDAITTLTINSTLTLLSGSTTIMQVGNNGGSLTSDLVTGLTGVTYGGKLVVTNIGPDALALGNTFTLFTLASGTYHNSFSSYVLPALPSPDLAWDTSKLTVDGSISVVAAAIPPGFGSIALANGKVVMSGSGGPTNGTYYVVNSTNVALPLAQWTPIATNQFDSSGNFIFTNTVGPANARSFFDIYYSH
jgi:autotransporter-associated beta strand protein